LIEAMHNACVGKVVEHLAGEIRAAGETRDG
jgi:hypothetical protein